MLGLKKEIESLIEKRQEGDYWDFKLEHHKNKADLLHDIICMANSRANRDCFIIYGVEDESYEVKGIDKEGSRRNQQQIIDFLKDKAFIGGVRPNIELKTLEIQQVEIDVLIIKNSYDVPYYLTKLYADGKTTVYANNIYTRVGDTNTPKREAADINYVEYLWRKRFLLHEPPLAQVTEMLKRKHEWKKTTTGYYHMNNPEFKIDFEYDEGRKFPEFYAYVMTNESVYYQKLDIKYHGTILESFVVVVLDGGRYSTVVPSSEFICLNDKLHFDYHFKYYDKSSLDYVLCEFLYDEFDDEEVYARYRLDSIVLTFEDGEEKDKFIRYVRQNSIQLKELIEQDTTSYSWIESNNRCAHESIVKEIKSGKALKKIFNQFKTKSI